MRMGVVIGVCRCWRPPVFRHPARFAHARAALKLPRYAPAPAEAGFSAGRPGPRHDALDPGSHGKTGFIRRRAI